MSIEEKVIEVIEEPIKSLGITLKEVKYEKENGTYYLRIFIDKEPFINIDDCVNVTNLINPILDKNDFIDSSYMLDISSIEKGGE
jgi:ribosome maturation factor RimP